MSLCSQDQQSSYNALMESLDRMKRGLGDHQCANAPNKNLCLPKTYSKFELPHTESLNVVEIGIDIIDVLRINDKVSTHCAFDACHPVTAGRRDAPCSPFP